MNNQHSKTNKNRLTSKAPLWRSLLYMPANNEKFLAKAQTRGADAIILDLEDSVAPDDKLKAREICKSAIPELINGPSDILVRINAPLRFAVRDIEASISLTANLKGALILTSISEGPFINSGIALLQISRAFNLSSGATLSSRSSIIASAPRVCAFARNFSLFAGM